MKPVKTEWEQNRTTVQIMKSQAKQQHAEREHNEAATINHDTLSKLRRERHDNIPNENNVGKNLERHEQVKTKPERNKNIIDDNLDNENPSERHYEQDNCRSQEEWVMQAIAPEWDITGAGNRQHCTDN